jgi:hypothetical protein
MVSLESPDDAQLVQLQDVVARHLLRFAFREPMQIEWHATEPGISPTNLAQPNRARPV